MVNDAINIKRIKSHELIGYKMERRITSSINSEQIKTINDEDTTSEDSNMSFSFNDLSTMKDDIRNNLQDLQKKTSNLIVSA